MRKNSYSRYLGISITILLLVGLSLQGVVAQTRVGMVDHLTNSGKISCADLAAQLTALSGVKVIAAPEIANVQVESLVIDIPTPLYAVLDQIKLKAPEVDYSINGDNFYLVAKVKSINVTAMPAIDNAPMTPAAVTGNNLAGFDATISSPIIQDTPLPKEDAVAADLPLVSGGKIEFVEVKTGERVIQKEIMLKHISTSDITYMLGYKDAKAPDVASKSKLRDRISRYFSPADNIYNYNQSMMTPPNGNSGYGGGNPSLAPTSIPGSASYGWGSSYGGYQHVAHQYGNPNDPYNNGGYNNGTNNGYNNGYNNGGYNNGTNNGGYNNGNNNGGYNNGGNNNGYNNGGYNNGNNGGYNTGGNNGGYNTGGNNNNGGGLNTPGGLPWPGDTTGTGTADLSGVLKGFLPKGITNIVGIPGTNSLMVQSKDEDSIKQLELLVSSLDQPIKQVTIQVQLVKMEAKEAVALGNSFSFAGVPFNFNANNSFGDSASTASYVNGNLRMAISALETAHKAYTVNAPQVVVQNGQQASFMMEDSVPFIYMNQTTDIYGQSYSTPTVYMQTFSQGLVVNKVVIHPDNTVTMRIEPIIEAPLGSVQIPGAPSVGNAASLMGYSRCTIDTVVTVKSGETIMMGGFTSRDDTQDDTRTPVLSQLPIIGSMFFHGRNKTKSSTQVMLFVTPIIYKDDNSNLGGFAMPGANFIH